MTDERTLRTAAAADACGADWAILTAPDALYYAAQVDTVIETGTVGVRRRPAARDRRPRRDARRRGQQPRRGRRASLGRGPRDGLPRARPARPHAGGVALPRRRWTRRWRALGVGGTVAVQAATLPVDASAELLAARGPTLVAIDAELNAPR